MATVLETFLKYSSACHLTLRGNECFQQVVDAIYIRRCKAIDGPYEGSDFAMCSGTRHT